MPTVQVRCPGCGRSYSINGLLLSSRARCRHCRRVFELGSSIESPAGSGPAPSSAEPELPMPEKVGRFEVRKRLGVGAFGAVYRAYDPSLDREVAVKVPHPGALDDARAVERF